MLFERERERREQLLWKRRAGKRERVGLALIKNNTHTKSGGALFFYFDQQQKSGTFSRSLNEREQKRKQRALCKDSLPEVIFRFDQKIRVGGRVFFFSKTIFFSLHFDCSPKCFNSPGQSPRSLNCPETMRAINLFRLEHRNQYRVPPPRRKTTELKHLDLGHLSRRSSLPSSPPARPLARRSTASTARSRSCGTTSLH